jgi:cobalamin synthase
VLCAQDEEDAKKGLYNWFAQSQRLLTVPRLVVATATAVLVPMALLGPLQAAVCCLTVAVVTAAAGWYGHAIIGGVVGDYLGATIQVSQGPGIRGQGLQRWCLMPTKMGHSCI